MAGVSIRHGVSKIFYTSELKYSASRGGCSKGNVLQSGLPHDVRIRDIEDSESWRSSPEFRLINISTTLYASNSIDKPLQQAHCHHVISK